VRISAEGLNYRELNERIRACVEGGERDIVLDDVRGHRYIGAGLGGDASITVNGTPGQDLACFMNGPRIVVNGNAQDGVANTMSEGVVVVHGGAGDVLGYSMRGGRVFVRGNAGYRVGIHMKEYRERFPVVIIGGSASDYLGEYMAGGLLVVLNMESEGGGASPAGEYVGTGMHGGMMFVRGALEPYQLGREVGAASPDADDWQLLQRHLGDFCNECSLDVSSFRRGDFIKLAPGSRRPYGRIYVY
jgi:glutamate synthase domain-containing protein 3